MSIESKTKEDILWSFPQGESEPYGHPPINRVYEAMDIYARSRAIEYLDWTRSEDCNYKWGSDGWYHWAESYQDGYKPISTAQLYELFSQQIDNHSIDK